MAKYVSGQSVRMSSGGEGDRTNSMEAVGFLARSQHRMRVLQKLDCEGMTRRQLHDSTGMSQPTLGRILGDFEDRGWIANHHNGLYSLTPVGALLGAALADLQGLIARSDDLAQVLEHLPWPDLDLDPSILANASITTPSEADPLAHMRRFDTLAEGADTVRVFSNVLACAPSDDATDADRAFLAAIDDLIITGSALDAGTGDDSLMEWLRDRVASGDLELYRFEGEAPFLYGLFDEAVGVVPVDGTGVPQGLIEAGPGPLYECIRDRFDTQREAGTRVSHETIPS